MNALAVEETFEVTLLEGDEVEVQPEERQGPWILKKLGPRHVAIAALVMQGKKNVEVASLVGVAPAYVSFVLRQPLVKEEIKRRAEAMGVQLDAMFGTVVEVIGDTLQNGSESGKLKAARLHLEATKRIGPRTEVAPSPESFNDRLLRLSERLVALLPANRPTKVYDHESSQATEATFVPRTAGRLAAPEEGQESEDSPE